MKWAFGAAACALKIVVPVNVKVISQKEIKMDWGSFLKQVAPSIATTLLGPAGPLVSVAASFMADKLDLSEKSVQAVTNALESGKMSPDQVTQIKLAEIQYQEFLQQHEIDLEKVYADDRDSARRREEAVKDVTPKVLAGGITLGFFVVLGYLINVGKPPAGGDALLVLLGSLATGFTGVLNYYFGSSSGSDAKTSVLAGIVKK